MRSGVNGPRSSAARRTHFDIDGEPMLDVTEELDLPERFRYFEVQLQCLSDREVPDENM